jgi:hypothetical protein
MNLLCCADTNGASQRPIAAAYPAAALRILLSHQTLADSDRVSLLPQRTLFVSQLARKHPVPFFQFLDSCARSADQLQTSVSDIPHLAQLAANGSGSIGVTGLAGLLSSPAATAALGSALCSILKLTAVYTERDTGAEAEAATAEVEEQLQLIMGLLRASVGSVSSTSLFPALQMLPLLQQLSGVLTAAVQHAMQTQSTSAAAAAAQPAASGSSSSSSRGEQARASSIFLMVLLCQRLLALHDAAAGTPGMPSAGIRRDKAETPMEVAPVLDNMVCNFMANVLAVFTPLPVLEMCFWTVDAAAVDADGAETAQTAADITLSLRLGSSSSSSWPVRWQHLLRLHESRKLIGAVAAFGEKWRASTIMSFLGHGDDALAKAFADCQADHVSSEQRMRLLQMYQDAMAFCHTLAAVAPLPVVCNNPQCTALHRVSEAAAARYVCAGCGCRYCSAACQAAGWRSHKKACKRMAACRMRVQG